MRCSLFFVNNEIRTVLNGIENVNAGGTWHLYKLVNVV